MPPLIKDMPLPYKNRTLIHFSVHFFYVRTIEEEVTYVLYVKSSTFENHPITHKQGVRTVKTEYRFHHSDLF